MITIGLALLCWGFFGGLAAGLWFAWALLAADLADAERRADVAEQQLAEHARAGFRVVSRLRPFDWRHDGGDAA